MAPQLFCLHGWAKNDFSKKQQSLDDCWPHSLSNLSPWQLQYSWILVFWLCVLAVRIGAPVLILPFLGTLDWALLEPVPMTRGRGESVQCPPSLCFLTWPHRNPLVPSSGRMRCHSEELCGFWDRNRLDFRQRLLYGKGMFLYLLFPALRELKYVFWIECTMVELPFHVKTLIQEAWLSNVF